MNSEPIKTQPLNGEDAAREQSSYKIDEHADTPPQREQAPPPSSPARVDEPAALDAHATGSSLTQPLGLETPYDPAPPDEPGSPQLAASAATQPLDLERAPASLYPAGEQPALAQPDAAPDPFAHVEEPLYYLPPAPQAVPPEPYTGKTYEALPIPPEHAPYAPPYTARAYAAPEIPPEHAPYAPRPAGQPLPDDDPELAGAGGAPVPVAADGATLDDAQIAPGAAPIGETQPVPGLRSRRLAYLEQLRRAASAAGHRSRSFAGRMRADLPRHGARWLDAAKKNKLLVLGTAMLLLLVLSQWLLGFGGGGIASLPSDQRTQTAEQQALGPGGATRTTDRSTTARPSGDPSTTLGAYPEPSGSPESDIPTEDPFAFPPTATTDPYPFGTADPVGTPIGDVPDLFPPTPTEFPTLFPTFPPFVPDPTEPPFVRPTDPPFVPDPTDSRIDPEETEDPYPGEDPPEPTQRPGGEDPINTPARSSTRAPTSTAGPPTPTAPPPATATPARPPAVVIAGQQRWTQANSPVILTNDHLLEAGASLTIDAGVEVRLASGVRFIINGSLDANGASGAPVRFISADGGHWSGIFVGEGGRANLNQIELRHAGSEGVAISSSGGALALRDSYLSDNLANVETRNSNVELRGNIITNNDLRREGAAVYLALSFSNSVTVASNRVESNRVSEGANGVELAINGRNTNITIERNRIVGTTGINLVLSASEPYRATLSCNTLAGGATGLNLRTSRPDLEGFAVAVSQNAFEGHLSRGAAGDLAFDVRNNWWGDPSGPYDAVNNPTGRGDAVGVQLIYNPWLDSRPACAA